MQHSLFTPGSVRAIQFAIHIGEQSSRAANNHDLLASLVESETHAGEILQTAGITVETLGLVLPPKLNTTPEGDPFGNETFDPSKFDERLIETLAESRKRAGRDRNAGEVGTEHLLAALVAIDSDVSPFLQEFGFDANWLSQFEPQITGTTAAPIDTNIRLEKVRTAIDEEHHVYRILDAAANRLREGLRVIEDDIRFRMNDAFLSQQLKSLRHEIQSVMNMIPAEKLMQSRDTTHDVGTGISTQSEMVRTTVFDVVAANCKRVEESLRTLEEFGKIINAEFAGKIEQIRYRFYTIEKALHSVNLNRERLADARLYLLVTSDLCHHGFGPAVRESIRAGVDIVQLREKELSDKRIIEMGHRIREWTRETGTLFIMNDRPDLAVITEADGVHVGQDELSASEARRIVGPGKFIGVSTHSIEQSRQAVLDGADYIGVGPVFPSQTKQFDEYAGLKFVEEVVAEITLPWFAIGGIDVENVSQVIDAGASRVAISNAICKAQRPDMVAGDLKTQLTTTAQGHHND